MPADMTLWRNPGWGSAIIEMQAAYYGLPLTLHEAGDTWEDGPARQALAAVNPLAQVPVLVRPDGGVMTESAAITLWLADLADSEALVPGPRAPERADFLRWLIFLGAAVYPTMSYGDSPQRWVPEDIEDLFQARMIGERQRLYLIMEAEAARQGGPWFLGSRMTAIDVYLAAMMHWRPREAWFAENAPRLLAAGRAVAALPAVGPVHDANFGE